MIYRTFSFSILAGALTLGCAGLTGPETLSAGGGGEILLIVRGDDMGSARTIDEACVQCYREGVVRSVEVMVPAPWFNHAAKLLRECPELDVGVHLTLTSEWENVKWGPLTAAPSLVDAQGKFFPATSQRKNYPPNTGFLQAPPKLEEVERELRAQIELAKASVPQVSHLTAHMGAPTCTPELEALVRRLAREYQLPLDLEGVKRAPGFGGARKTPAEKEAAFVDTLEGLTAGTWLFVDHPGLDTPEMRALGHKGYEHVAADRVGVTYAFCSPKAKRVIARRHIQLISYADWLKRRP